MTGSRQGVQAAFDATVAAGTLVLGTWLRCGFTVPDESVGALAVMMPLAVVLQVGIGMLLVLYRRRWSYGSFGEVAALAQCVAANGVLLVAASVVLVDRRVPVGAALIAAPFALVIMAGARYLWRLREEHYRRPDRDVARPPRSSFASCRGWPPRPVSRYWCSRRWRPPRCTITRPGQCAV